MSSSVRTTIQSRWDLRPPTGGTAVVIDVLRFSTTLCALLTAGRKNIRVTDTPETLLQSPDIASADVFSELQFEFPGKHYDNSPDVALRRGQADRITYVTTTSGSRALAASRDASRIFIGGFTNFDAIVRRLRKVRDHIWFVPAAPPVRPNCIEDDLCARAFIEALQGRKDAAANALSILKKSPRIPEFLRLKLSTGKKDLAYCLNVNRLPVVPEAVYKPRTNGHSAPFAKIRKAQ